MDFDLTQTDELLGTTRAVRKRLDLERPVSRTVIQECLELAIQAPTGGNRQGWRWLVIDNPEQRAKLAEICRRTAGGRFRDSEAQAREKGDIQTARAYEGADYLLDHLHEVPVHVIPCIEGRPTDDMVPARWVALMGSIFPAIWSFQLALRSRGLGSVLTTVHLFAEHEIAELLSIPSEVMQIALLPVAYTKGTDFKRARRTPVEEITHWNRW